MTDSDARKVFGKNLTDILYEKHISQRQLGQYMKVSSATTSDWCSGKKMPRIDKLTSIANYLHVTMGDLVEEHIDGYFKPYYFDDDIADLAHEMYKDVNKRHLLESSLNRSPEDIALVIDILQRLDDYDRAEIRGEIKQMLKAEKYS